MAFDVFISYSSKDKTTANAVCAALESSGIRCWIAPRDINAGTEYAASIVDGIDACRVMVLIFSSSANASPQIHREIERAVSKALTIIPFRIENVLPTKAMEYYLGSIHWLDALTPPVAKYIEQLTEQVKANLQIDAAASATPETPFRKTATEKAPFRDYRNQAKRSYLPFALIASIATMGLLVASVLLLWNFRSLPPPAVEPASPPATASGLTIRRSQPFGGDGGAAFDDSDSNPAHLPLSALSIIVNLNPADTTQRIIGGLQAQWADKLGLLHGAKGPYAQPAMAVKFNNNEKIGKVVVNAVSYHFPAAVPPTWIAGLEIWTDVRVYTLGDMTLGPAKQTAEGPSQCLLDYGEPCWVFLDDPVVTLTRLVASLENQSSCCRIQLPLLAQSGHPTRARQCPLLGVSGHRDLMTSCLLLTQSGHRQRPPDHFHSAGLTVRCQLRARGRHMRRREFIALVGGAAVAWPLTAPAQQPLPAVGFLHPASPEAFPQIVDGFRRGLNDAGFIEGQNVTIEYRWARGEYDRLPGLALDLVQRGVRVILAGGGEGAALAAKAATSTTPILINTSSDPVKSGLVASFNRPGGNITGLMTATSTLEAKKFGLLCEMLPNARVIAMLINPNYPPNAADAAEVQSTAQTIGRQLFVLKADSPQTIESAIANLVAQRADALLVAGDPFLEGRSQQIITLTTRQGVPAIYNFRESVVRGGLMSYGVNISNNYQQLGVYAGRILKGESAADLPIIFPTAFDFAINLVTAKALGLQVPPMLLARADQVIE